MKNCGLAFWSMAVFSVAGCGTNHSKGDEVLSVSGSSKNTASSGTENSPSSAGTGATTGSGSTSFSLNDAKPLCISCHVTGGSGAGVWATADGTEADWKTFASTARSSVDAGRMPPVAMSADNKSKFLVYMDQLLGVSTAAPTPTTTPGASTGGTLVFTINEAAPYCSGCHPSNATGGSNKWPLVTLADWNNRSRYSRSKLYSVVNGGSMPKGSPMQNPQKAAMLNFINSLNP